ncbi:major facilitator superfamily domain-containing protein [Suillus fuscotomentosus]|uniref:Major facilitator superfamily domain-containing protein n=1 Tax=Suillus fuscotomentosus TaxID=1912939 RepID=A0AAD4HCA1_9AGAM|nr:major facilitator superfamily domain-containing protein [Suillus fuscotomentosus]KAG1887485.1 major facilitator superfamily domain-containing protein [Suillus fuscotomentosus]
MAAESEHRTVHTTEGVVPQENKECSETLEVCHISNNWDLPSSLHEFSEGGLAGWATAFGSFLVQFCAFGYITSFGVYQGIAADEHILKTCRWIGSTTAFLLMTVSLVSGSLHDRGYLKIFLSQGLGLGIASGLVYIPTMAVISHHFRRRRTLVMTFVATGSPLGAIIHPIMLNNLLNGPLGFANGVRVSAGFTSLFLLTACLSMRTRLDPPATPVNYIAVARKCIYDVPFMLLIAGTFLLQTGFYYPLFFFQLDSIKHGISVKFSFYSLVILNGSNCLGRFTSGLIASFTGVLNLTIVASTSCGVLILGMIGLSNLASVVVLGMLYGYFSGLNVAMAPPLVATLTPDLSELGARMGICLFAAVKLVAITIGFGGLIGAPISGALLTSNYTWWIPGLFSGTVSLAAAIMFIVMRYVFLKRQRVLVCILQIYSVSLDCHRDDKQPGLATSFNRIPIREKKRNLK